MNKYLLYYHTVKYLKFSQIYHRILKRFIHPKPCDVDNVLLSTVSENWVTQRLYQQKFVSENEVCFLNYYGKVEKYGDWNTDKQTKLWLYNLHYFDDLNAFSGKERFQLQLSWINKWIKENPVEQLGNGWEPYPISLRVVNWVKASLSGLPFDKSINKSLAQQVDYLSQDLEKHLLGNHYFVNLKALIFAGCYFEGEPANNWLALGLKDYTKELYEQILDDGGCFELSPMYHAIMLTDLLDLYNLFCTYPNKVPSKLKKLTKSKIIKMFNWLEYMSHKDKQISFFNDSALGIAPENDIIFYYAYKLGIEIPKSEYSNNELIIKDLKDSGYISVFNNDFKLIADLAEVGPSYIPGHAHADSLSFEFSLGCSRVFVNSGTSEYGMSNERLRQRGTNAHNTVVVNDVNSSEVWSGFRVARRANIHERNVLKNIESVNFSAYHDGYKKQGINLFHHRKWDVNSSSILIKDKLEGKYDSSVANFYLHPNVKIISAEKSRCTLSIDGYEVLFTVEGGDISIHNTTYHPEFGKIVTSHKLSVAFQSDEAIYNISWKNN